MSKAEDAARIMFEQMEWFKKKLDEEEREKKNLTKSDTNGIIRKDMKGEHEILLKRRRIGYLDRWGPKSKIIELWLLPDGRVEQVEIVEDDGFMRGRPRTGAVTHYLKGIKRRHYTTYLPSERKKWNVDPEEVFGNKNTKEKPNDNPN